MITATYVFSENLVIMPPRVKFNVGNKIWIVGQLESTGDGSEGLIIEVGCFLIACRITDLCFGALRPHRGYSSTVVNESLDSSLIGENQTRFYIDCLNQTRSNGFVVPKSDLYQT
jgi:hypothetical protein